MQKIVTLIALLFASSLSLADVTPPAGTKDSFNGVNYNGAGLYKVGDLYLRDDDTNTMLLAAPAALADDTIQFVLPSTEGTANQCLATDGSGVSSWIDVIRPGLASIVNADVNASAAIARSKLASGTADHVVINGVAGAFSSEAQLDRTRGGTGITSTATFPSSGTVTTNDATATVQNKTLDTTNTINALDTGFEVRDNLDPSKRFAFDATNVSASTTRTYGVPNADTTLVGTNVSQTLTNKTIDANSNTVSNVDLVTDITGTLGTTNGGTGVSGSATFPSTGTVTTDAGVSTFTNKTIDADGTGNAISNLENADIKVGAAIARTKLASGTLDHVLINDGSGVMSSEATLAITRGGTGQATANAALNALLPSQTSQSGEVLTTNGTNAAWEPVLVNPMDSAGDIIVGGASGVATKLDAGTTSQVLIGGTSPAWGGVSSTLITDGTIVNADINASAAIAGSKLQAASASNAGVVDTSTQTFAGLKGFDDGAIIKGQVGGATPSAGYIGEMITKNLTVTTTTTAADTATINTTDDLVVTAGNWELCYHLSVGGANNAGSAQAIFCKVAVATSGGTVVGGSEMGVGNNNQPTGTSITQSLTQCTDLNVTGTTTYRVRVYANQATANGACSIFATNIFAGITNPDSTPKFYVKRSY